jgi:hypothetical protein
VNLLRITSGLNGDRPVASTWSWAKTDVPMRVCFNLKGCKIEDIAQIMTLEVIYIDSNNGFGQLRRASMTISAPSASCTWTLQDNSNKCKEMTTPGFELPTHISLG